MKRIILTLLILFNILSQPVLAADEIGVYLNDEKLAFEQPPIIRNDSTLVPFRAIFEKLGMQVEWNGEKRRVTAKGGDTDITLYIDVNEMYVNGAKVLLNTPPVIYNDFTLVPLRAVSEAAGAQVDWDGNTRTVTITVISEDIGEWAYAVLRLTNEERKKEGLNPLKWNDTLALLAEAHCEDMIERNFFDHVNPDGETPFDRIKKYNIEYWTAGENIGVGQQSPEQVVAEWMKSQTHRENILNPNFKSIGISILKGGSYGMYWVQEFAWFKE